MKKTLNQLENFQDKIRAIPEEEWYAAGRVVIAQKRQETGNAKWIPTFHNGRHEFEERTIALVEEKRKK